MAHVFRIPKVPDFGSRFQRSRIFGSWLMFSKDQWYFWVLLMFSMDQRLWILAHVFRGLGFWGLAHVFKGPRVLDPDSCFKKPRIFGSWLMFSEDQGFFGLWLMFSEDQGFFGF